MTSFKKLPENYREIFSLDLTGNRDQFIKINVIALIIFVLAFIAGAFIDPVEFEGILFFIKTAAAIAATFIYMLLHEFTHGIFMKLFGAKDVSYGFKTGFAYAGSSFYFKKIPYIIVALSPVIILGAILLILNISLGEKWFWMIYAVQITNLSGAAGDYYAAYKFLKFPKETLIKDTGTKMKVYCK